MLPAWLRRRTSALLRLGDFEGLKGSDVMRKWIDVFMRFGPMIAAFERFGYARGRIREFPRAGRH
jgi:hypothetical protein